MKWKMIGEENRLILANYSYEMLKESLLNGREIEFVYHNKLYGIIRAVEGGWFICVDNKTIASNADAINLIENSKIEGMPIKTIFDDQLFELESLYVL